MKFLYAFLCFCFILLFGYLLGSFITMSFNPAEWPESTRSLVAFLASFFGASAATVTLLVECV